LALMDTVCPPKSWSPTAGCRTTICNRHTISNWTVQCY
jgi:hypothetical protein